MDHAQDIIGASPAHQRALREAKLIASTSAPVVIHGESGTGKELFARTIHERSGRKGQLVVVSCATLPEQLAESLLFGHRRGAFTGATESSDGLFVAAHEGTLFLDEIAELSLLVQAKLLRALQQGAVLPVGEARERPVDARVIAASHRDLRASVREGRFREDLYFRLARFELTLPPLRERDRDVLLIARRYLEQEPSLGGRSWLSRTAEVELMRHRWPGNVRELQNVLFQLAVRASGLITAEDVRAALGTAEAPAGDSAARVLALVDAEGEQSRRDLALATHLSASNLKRILNSLVKAGELVMVGNARATRYRRALPGERLDDRSRTAIAIARRSGRVTRTMLALEHGIPARTAGRVLARLVEEGLLAPDGQQGCAAGYVLPEPSESPSQPSPC